MKKIFLLMLFIASCSKIFASENNDSIDCNCAQAATLEVNLFQLLNIAPNIAFTYYSHKNVGLLFKAEYDFNTITNLLEKPYNLSQSTINGFRLNAGLVTKTKLSKTLIWKNYLMLGFAKMNRKDSIVIPNYYNNYRSEIKFSNTYQTIEINTALETKINKKMSLQVGLGYNIIASILQNDYNYKPYLSRGTLVTNNLTYKPFEAINGFTLSGFMIVVKLNFDFQIKKRT
jgi:hypothetical protein